MDLTVIPPSPFILDAATNENIPNSAYLNWNRVDQSLQSWLQASLSQPVFADLPDFLSSRDLWQYLTATYAAPTSSRAIQLRHQLQTINKENLSVAAYLAKITSIKDSLKSSSSPATDIELVLSTLRGLGLEYQPFSTAIEARERLPSFAELKPLLLNYEIRLTQYHQPTADPNSPSAFFGCHQSSSSSAPATYSSGSPSSAPNRSSFSSGRGGRWRGGSFRGGRGGRGRSQYYGHQNQFYGSSSSSFGPQHQRSILGAPPSTYASPRNCYIYKRYKVVKISQNMLAK
ncbi:hypothetical protein BVC80_1035g12 [Macleaya cordata]|uniref:Retrotransposon gag domain-containing protein n=1 Tax=Macleaya cordata TaxID=56857 RepID=A0A200QVQ9_MACCD|nr:hypothetical protein BVC80_1035g12 [Macleaya cordata]